MNDLQRLRRLRRQVEARVDELDVPTPFDVTLMCERLGARRGRPIRLRAEATASGLCGLWAEVAGVDYIVYERDTTPLHQEQIILHEIGHLLAEHGPTAISDHESLALLMPDLDPEMVRRVVERRGYSSEEEQEAELLATLVLERAGRTKSSPLGAPSAEDGRALDMLDSILNRDDGR